VNVGILKIEIYLGDTFSLKDKRSIVKSVVERLKGKFNLSVAEVERQNDLRFAVIGISCVSSSKNHAESQLESALNFLEEDGRFFVQNIEREVFFF